MRYILHIALLALLVGCGASVSRGGIKHVDPTCIRANKDTAWDEYSHWLNVMLRARRFRIEQCVWRPIFDPYCLELDAYHTKVENYVKVLRKRYAETCPVKGMLLY